MSLRSSIRAVRVCAALLCLFGAGVVIREFVRLLLVFPQAGALAAVLELPLVLFGFALLRRLRPTRAPALLWSAAALVWGATAAAGCALLANQGLAGLWAKSEGVKFASDWSASLTAPLNEELLKLCGVVMVALAAPLAINGPLDGLVYGALTGLGFQAVENVTYGLNAVIMSGGTNPDRAVLDSALLRIGTAGLGSHWAMTAVAGAGAGYLILHTRRRRLIRAASRAGFTNREPADSRAAGPGFGLLLAAAACLIAAIGMHLLFDAPALPIELKVAVNFALVAIFYLLLSSAFLHRARELLAAAVAAGLVSSADAAALLSRRRRLQELRQIHLPADRDKLRERQQDILTELDAEAA